MTSPSQQLYQCLVVPSGDYRDPFDVQAMRMAVVHNTIIRAINAMITYAPEVTASQLRAFFKFCGLFELIVHTHHHHEEENYFPALEEKLGEGAMSGNVQGHRAFDSYFEAWCELRKGFEEGKRPWSPPEFVAAVRAFADPLRDHLQEEIDTLNADVLRSKFTRDELQELDETAEKKILSKLDPVWHPGFIFVNGDAVTGGWFPTMPKVVRFVCRHILYWLHSDVWQFGSSDRYMRVKERFRAAEPPLPQ
ncbi:hypothetical protein FRC02_002925 [Tulasnella sp. 418]|nr:hypothetical protein FRC02_002925 [Tulasnella sp. 418]